MKCIKGVLVLTILLFITTACGDGSDYADDVAQPSIGLKFLMETDSGGCPVSQQETSNSQYAEDSLPANIQRLKFRLYAQDGTVLLPAEGGSDPLAGDVMVQSDCESDPYHCVTPGAQGFKLFDIPTGQNMVLEVKAYDSRDLDTDEHLIWEGSNYNVDVVQEQTDANAEAVAVDIYMRRVGKMTFAFGCMETERMLHTATVLRDGMHVLITGGVPVIREEACSPEEFGENRECDLLVATKQVVMFNMETGDFTVMQPLTLKRAGHQAVLLVDGRVLIMGGAAQVQLLHNGDGQAYMQADIDQVHANAVLYNPDGFGSVEPIDIPMNQRRAFMTVTPIDNDPPDATRFLVAGGWGDGGRLSTFEMLSFDPHAGQSIPEFKLLSSVQMKAPRSSHTATRVRSGHVLLYGGTAPGEPVAEIFTSELVGSEIPTEFDGYENWPNMYNHAAVAYPDGEKALITGGMQKTADGSAEKLGEPLATALLIDFSTSTAQIFQMKNARAFHQMAILPNGLPAVFGGANSVKLREGVSVVEMFTGASFAFVTDNNGENVQLGLIPGNQLPLARMGHTLNTLRDGSILLVGGSNPSPIATNPRNKEILRSAEVLFPLPQ